MIAHENAILHLMKATAGFPTEQSEQVIFKSSLLVLLIVAGSWLVALIYYALAA